MTTETHVLTTWLGRSPGKSHNPRMVIDYIHEQQEEKKSVLQNLASAKSKRREEHAQLQMLKQTLKQTIEGIKKSQQQIKDVHGHQVELLGSLATVHSNLAALCIRALDDSLLTTILRFASGDDRFALVSQQWNRCWNEVGGRGGELRTLKLETQTEAEGSTENVLAL